MENYKKKLAQRQTLLGLGLVLIAVCVLTLNHFFAADTTHETDFIRGFQFGLFTGLELLMVCQIFKILGALRSEAKLKAMYIAETDERRQSIRLHTFATSGIASLGLLAFAAIVAGFFSKTVCITLILALFGECVIKLPFKLYYAKKF